jgi:tetratricopeptide (TPR) repeat protein
MVDDFPTQPSVYYQLARYYMGMENVDEAIDVLKKASLEFNIPPESFSYLTQLYAENEKFIGRYNQLMAYYLTAETTVFPDSKWIALYDSIKEQDQLYRGKYRPDDPRFEPQLQIDEQNALFLRELVIEHWSTPCLLFVLLYLL